MSTSSLSYYRLSDPKMQPQAKSIHLNDSQNSMLPPLLMFNTEKQKSDSMSSATSSAGSTAYLSSLHSNRSSFTNVSSDEKIPIGNAVNLGISSDNHHNVSKVNPLMTPLYGQTAHANIMLPPLGLPSYSYGGMPHNDNQITNHQLPPLYKIESHLIGQQDFLVNVDNSSTNSLIRNNLSNEASSLDSKYPLTHHLKPKTVASSLRSRTPTYNPRKKRECPVCHKFFSNLTTHKTIHNEDSKPFSCNTCHRAFKRLNDLLRHEKCHLSKLGEWEYQCPFHPGKGAEGETGTQAVIQTEAQTETVNAHEICHHTGLFTRCDTYKNHLKAIHFKYPHNTPKSSRGKVSGECKECGQHFNNVNDWMVDHIETGNCSKILSFRPS